MLLNTAQEKTLASSRRTSMPSTIEALLDSDGRGEGLESKARIRTLTLPPQHNTTRVLAAFFLVAFLLIETSCDQALTCQPRLQALRAEDRVTLPAGLLRWSAPSGLGQVLER